ncbi:MAG: hypothetical protein BIFFINMI_01208 [Phycisphaerae bacterium]|nr:hypothetical protein [Phycisphaerae bacterium]
MITKQIEADFCVVGGGISGLCAAITAARHGLRTVLIQDRPVLGGNASSEIRVWIQGATSSGRNRYAREGGVLNELYLEHMWRNPESNAHLLDALLLEMVTREPNLTLLLDAAVYECAMAADGRIASAAAFCSLNQTRYVVAAPLFADASGDGILGFLAGAEFRMGRESRDEYGEPFAPEQADNLTLGDSMYFYSKRHSHPVRFTPPAYAIDITTIGMNDYRFRRLSTMAEPYGCELWWVEYGGRLNTVYDADKIKHHLTCLVYGIWDYIKNSGKFADVDDLTLEWVSSYPGKRESRRFLGPHVLKQHEILAQEPFADGIGAAGWSIDLHPSDGIYSKEKPSQHLHPDWVYNVPFRCLYSRNVDNLLLAGRLISASHVAFGSIRVMGTGGMCGQAAGVAAAICHRDGTMPKDISADPARVRELQQSLLRDGQHIPGLRNEDPADLARAATVTASSTYALHDRTDADAEIRLADGGYIILPVADPATEWAELQFRADADTTLEYQLKLNDRIVNYHPNVDAGTHTLNLPAGRAVWHRLPLPRLAAPQNVWVILPKRSDVVLLCTRMRAAGLVVEDYSQRRLTFSRFQYCPTIRLPRQQRLYEPANVIDGYHRPHVFPHSWVSGPLTDGPQWIELALPGPAAVGTVQLTFNGDVNMHIQTALDEVDRRDVPELVKDCDVELLDAGGQCTRRIEVRDNHQIMLRLDAGGATASRVRVTVLAARDHDRAEIHEVRLYAKN